MSIDKNTPGKVRGPLFRWVVSIKALLLLVLVIALAAPSRYWWTRLENVRDKYEIECGRTSEGTPKTLEDLTGKGTDSMKEQSALLLSWAFGILGAAIALVTTTGTHRFEGIRVLFLILAPALSFLTGSLWAGLLFQRRLTWLQLNDCAARGTLNDLLLAQNELLRYAICALAVFALACLLQIVMGWVDPREGKE